MQYADVSGFSCFYRTGSIKRRWPGRTAKALKQHIGEPNNANDRELFLKWRDGDINYILEHGCIPPPHISRASERNLTTNVLREKFDLMDIVVF